MNQRFHYFRLYQMNRLNLNYHLNQKFLKNHSSLMFQNFHLYLNYLTNQKFHLTLNYR